MFDPQIQVALAQLCFLQSLWIQQNQERVMNEKPENRNHPEPDKTSARAEELERSWPALSKAKSANPKKRLPPRWNDGGVSANSSVPS